MSLSLTQSKANIEKTLGMKFETEADARKACIAVQHLLAESEHKYNIGQGRFVDVEDPKKKTGIDGLFGDVMVGATKKWLKDEPKGKEAIQDAIAKALKPTTQGPLQPPKPTEPPKPPTKSEKLGNLWARNWVYEKDAPISDKAISDRHEVELDVDPRPPMQGKAERLFNQYHLLRETAIDRLQKAKNAYEAAEAAEKSAQNDAAKQAAAKKKDDAGAALVHYKTVVLSLDRAAKQAAEGKSAPDMGGDADVRNLVLSLRTNSALMGVKFDNILDQQLTKDYPGALALPVEQDFKSTKPVAAQVYHATSAQPFTAKVTYANGKMHVEPKAVYNGAHNVLGYYQAIMSIYQGSKEGERLPPLSLKQFMQLVDSNTDLKAGLAAWNQHQAFDLPRDLHVISFWGAQPTSNAPNASAQ